MLKIYYFIYIVEHYSKLIGKALESFYAYTQNSLTTSHKQSLQILLIIYIKYSW